MWCCCVGPPYPLTTLRVSVCMCVCGQVGSAIGLIPVPPATESDAVEAVGNDAVALEVGPPYIGPYLAPI